MSSIALTMCLIVFVVVLAGTVFVFMTSGGFFPRHQSRSIHHTPTKHRPRAA